MPQTFLAAFKNLKSEYQIERKVTKLLFGSPHKNGHIQTNF
jgi:hypothetical protein